MTFSREQKIFGLGLSKTATSSLTEALNLLGIKTIHYPSDEETLHELQNGNYRLSLMKDWQGATDISIAPFYAQLDKAFPGSKFILTVREKKSWLRSCEQHWRLMDEWLENFPEIKRFQDFIGAVVYGTLKFNRDRFSFVYDNHLAAVRRYFENRPKDFLEIDICGGEGWKEIGDFLQIEIPDKPFPKANEWMHLLMNAKLSVEKIIPAGEKIALLDQTGFGSQFAPALEILPFPERDGIYWGIPESDKSANQELLAITEKGIEFFVAGFPCFWWFDYYPTFNRNLYKNFSLIFENESVKIFKLKDK